MFNSSNLSDIVAELNWKSLTQHMSFMLVPAAPAPMKSLIF